MVGLPNEVQKQVKKIENMSVDTVLQKLERLATRPSAAYDILAGRVPEVKLLGAVIAALDDLVDEGAFHPAVAIACERKLRAVIPLLCDEEKVRTSPSVLDVSVLMEPKKGGVKSVQLNNN